MASEYDFMLPEDRAQKEADSRANRQAWLSTRNRGIARFLLLHELNRTVVLVIAWGVFLVVFRQANLPELLKFIGFVLLTQVILNLLQWHRNGRRYGETKAL